MKSDNQLPWNSSSEFYDIHADYFFSNGGFYHSNMIGKTDESFADYILSKLNLQPDSIVVDLGCGSGYLVNRISKICKCIGISNSSKSIDLARKKFPMCHFEVADMENFIFPGVTHFLSLESIGYSNVVNTLKNVYDQLPNNGIFYIKDISFVPDPTIEETENINYWVSYWKYKTFSVSEMIQRAYEIGFKLNSFRDLHLDTRLNIKTFMETLQFNIVPEEYPHPEVGIHIGTEFIFQKKKREKWINPYV